MWGMTKALVAGVSEFDEYTPVNTRKWNAVLRDLGYVGFNDPGFGLIHGAEHTQAVFLTTSAFRVVDHMLKNRKQRTVDLGDKKYKGGRLPRDLYMAGIPNTLFYNHEPADFAKVRTWTLGGVGIHELSSFFHFLPWNAIGIINNLVIGNAANESYENGYTKQFFEKPLPKNVRIKNIYVGRRYPDQLLRYIPPDFPVETITISPFASDAGLDRIPEPLRSKDQSLKRILIHQYLASNHMTRPLMNM